MTKTGRRGVRLCFQAHWSHPWPVLLRILSCFSRRRHCPPCPFLSNWWWWWVPLVHRELPVPGVHGRWKPGVTSRGSGSRYTLFKFFINLTPVPSVFQAWFYFQQCGLRPDARCGRPAFRRSVFPVLSPPFVFTWNVSHKCCLSHDRAQLKLSVYFLSPERIAFKAILLPKFHWWRLEICVPDTWRFSQRRSLSQMPTVLIWYPFFLALLFVWLLIGKTETKSK